MTFELFVIFMGGLLFICGLFAWYMAFEMYQRFIFAYIASYEIQEKITKYLASRPSHIRPNFEAASGGDSDVQTQNPEP